MEDFDDEEDDSDVEEAMMTDLSTNIHHSQCQSCSVLAKALKRVRSLIRENSRLHCFISLV